MTTSRIALGVEYNGSRFNGWQMQLQDARTVQDQVQKALSKVADHPVSVVCAGRTDTGVHATAQVVHFDTTAERKLKAWVMGSNVHLPEDVSILWAKPVDNDFSARFSATKRSYRYVILNRSARTAIHGKQVTWVHDALDVEAMHAAAQALVGEHDFSSFRSSICQAKHARRMMHSINVSREGEYIYLDLCANAFLHHMVRNIVGSLLMIGRGEQPVTWMADLLALKDRSKAGPTAAAYGLYLVAVEYPQQYDLPSAGILPRFA
ncbi:MAG: tRNA pseudouridine(38-40) synthase TruA [Gammaproteobacteria bacterium]|nr:tRNA pseudouridine(38-40) synthase TruA [Gammaproteobacteria bacterium]